MREILLSGLQRVFIVHSIFIRDFAANAQMSKIMLIQGFSYRFNK